MGGQATIILNLIILFQILNFNFNDATEETSPDVASTVSIDTFDIGDKAIFRNLKDFAAVNGIECQIIGDMIQHEDGNDRLPVRFINPEDGKTTERAVKPINLKKIQATPSRGM